MFRRIVVPVDLTAKNARAIAAARELAMQGRGQVFVLHVIEMLDAPFDELADFYKQLEARAREQLEALTRPLQEAGVLLEQHVRYGKRVAEIVRYAEERDADLILIGSHRPEPEHPKETLLTISHQVAIVASCPVLVLK